MLFFIFSALLNAFVSSLLGFVIIFKNRKELINRLFLGLSVSVVFWSLSYWRWMSSNTYNDALFWSRLLSVGSLFIPIFYFHWIITFLDQNKNHKKIIKIVYLFGLTTLCLSFSKWFIPAVEPKLFFPFWPIPGILYHFYLIFIYLGLIFYSLFLLWQKYRKTQESEKSRIKYIIIGSIIGFIGGATNFFLWYNLPIPPYGNALVFIYCFVLAIAILKYNLFNIKVISTELFVAIIWIFVSILLFTAESSEQMFIYGILLFGLIIFGIVLILGVLKEVKTREEMEKLAEKLEIANMRLKELDKAKSEFITIASHQLRTPLTAIKGYTSMAVEGDFGKIPVQAKKMLKRVMQSTNRMIYLIDDFLNLSRIERGKMKYDFQKTDVKYIVSNLINEFAGITAKEKKEIKLNFKIDEKENYIASADQNKITQVFNNLIDNAIKYTPQGFVNVWLYKENGNIIFKVQDSGIGMSKETQVQVFHKFTRAGEEASQIHTEGLGLGLYVSKEIIEAHKGKIWAESEGQEKGSIFYVQLPAIKD